MARKSPRSRRKPASAPRVPGAVRAPSSPRKRARIRPATSANGAHATTTRTPPGRAKPSRGTKPSRPAPSPRLPRGRYRTPDPERVAVVLEILERTYPNAHTALSFENPLQLLIATILSAQCTDARVNLVTPGLFARFPDAAALAAATQDELEGMIRSTGFFRMKSQAIRACCADIVSKHGGEVPRTLEDLVQLRGVGRKTANVVLGNAFGIPGIAVDTHVTRVAFRLGFTREKDPVKIEFALMKIVPREQWAMLTHWLILHGRAICVARKPRCSICPLLPHCPRLGVTLSE